MNDHPRFSRGDAANGDSRRAILSRRAFLVPRGSEPGPAGGLHGALAHASGSHCIGPGRR